MKKLLLILILLSFSGISYSAEKDITHVVVVWLNDGLNDEAISEIINKTHILSDIAAVRELQIGRPIASERDIVDDSFTFAISVTFENAADMKVYAVDKSHLNYVKTVLKPALKKIVIYDF